MNRGLEALEKLKRDLKEHCLSDTAKDIQYQTIEEELKALEVIKEKIKIEFNDHYFGIKGNYYIIVNNDVFGAIKVDKEEYDLLKEVLL